MPGPVPGQPQESIGTPATDANPAPLLGADGAQDVEPGGPAGQEHGRTIKR